MNKNRLMQALALVAMAATLRYFWLDSHRYGIPSDVFQHPRQLIGVFHFSPHRAQSDSTVGNTLVARRAWVDGYDCLGPKDIPEGATVEATVVEVATVMGPVLVATSVESKDRLYFSQTAADVLAAWNAGANRSFNDKALWTVGWSMIALLVLKPKDKAI